MRFRELGEAGGDPGGEGEAAREPGGEEAGDDEAAEGVAEIAGGIAKLRGKYNYLKKRARDRNRQRLAMRTVLVVERRKDGFGSA